ncbi:MAG: lysine--tRNA ligase, partial [Candidatus Aenigmarchaeota archaeon]|nr:lysine--tRNA ligase [Candidatus Aenigmarchaeota archaeon]
AAKWPTQGVIMETAGKDHFSKGGSRSVAIAIADEVFDYPAPYPSTRTEPGEAYEFFTIGGKKMSTSKGRGISFDEMTSYAPANMLRYLLIKTRPRAVIDFDPIGTNKMILLFESYDKTERIYYGKEQIENERELMHEKRVYELSHVGKIKKTMPPQVPFTHAAMLLQILPNMKSVIDSLKSTGHLASKLSKEDETYITERLDFVKNWVEKFAPEEYKFIINDKITDETKNALSDEQKKALLDLAIALEKPLTEIKMVEQFKKIAENNNIKPKDLFGAAYLALLSKTRGPRLTSLITSLGQDKVRTVLKMV